MSRIGKHPVPVPDGVNVAVEGQRVSVKGRLGELSEILPPEVEVGQDDGAIVVKPRRDEQRERAMWGLARSLVANMVHGVANGFEQRLEISGVGYRASSDGQILTLQLGFSHDIKYAIPDGIEIVCDTPTQIRIRGASRQQVGQIASEIRRFRKPEPYKGKGIRYAGEQILRKEGKKK